MLALAVTMQYGFGKQPCAWCVFQRLVFVAIAVVCGAGALLARARTAQIAAALLAGLLAAGGAVAALYLHFVASRSDSCALTFADKVIMALSLHEIAPWMFFAEAPCNLANPPLLGVPFALWAFTAFVAVGAGISLALAALLREGRPGLRG